MDRALADVVALVTSVAAAAVTAVLSAWLLVPMLVLLGVLALWPLGLAVLALYGLSAVLS